MSWEDILKEQGPLSNFIADLLYDFPDAKLSVVKQKEGFADRELRQAYSPDSKIESDENRILRIVRNIPLEVQNKLVIPIADLFHYRYIQGVGEYFGKPPFISASFSGKPILFEKKEWTDTPNFRSIDIRAGINNDAPSEYENSAVFRLGLIIDNQSTSEEKDITKVSITIKNLTRTEDGSVYGKQSERRKKFREAAHMRLKPFILNKNRREK